MLRFRSLVAMVLMAIALSVTTACGKGGNPNSPSTNNPPPVSLSLTPQSFLMYRGGEQTVTASGVGATVRVDFAVVPAACGTVTPHPSQPYAGILRAGMEERGDCQVVASASGAQTAGSFQIVSDSRLELLNKSEVCGVTINHGQNVNARIRYVVPSLGGVMMLAYYETASGGQLVVGQSYNPPSISAQQGEVVYPFPQLARGTAVRLVVQLKETTNLEVIKELVEPCVLTVQ